MRSWAFQAGSFLFFTFVFVVFYAIAWSVILGIRDNYYRYAQKASLQWTGPRKAARPRPRKAVLILSLLTLAVLTSWLVVAFIIFP